MLELKIHQNQKMYKELDKDNTFAVTLETIP
jgi:hypothetical protein